jgi:hypothetical protein
MVERTNSETNNVYDEYLYLNDNWEKIGSTEVDLTDYLKKTDLTFTNGLSESDGTVSWNLSDRIAAGSGDVSIREGDITNNQAGGNYSHAEGGNTSAYGAYSHAEGSQTQARGPCSHAEGLYSRATGN